jgi:hypothetical protein
VPGGLRLFVGIDLRRPASWITLAVGCWVGWRCATSTTAGSGIAMLSAAVLAVAAIGDIPLAVCLPAGRGQTLFWCCERAGWPLVGMMLGILAAGGGPDWPETGSFGILAAATIGTLLAAVTTVASRLSGAKAADAASLTLLMAAASAAASVGLAPRLGGSCIGGVAAWLLLGGLVWAWSRSQRTAIEAVLPGAHRAGHAAGGDVLHVDALPANGPLRQTLSRLAMVVALAAMAGWLVLEPAIEPAVEPAVGRGPDHVGQNGLWDRLVQVHQAAMVWALITAAWFIALAVPQATLQDGMAGVRGWEQLFRTAAHVRHESAARWRSIWSLRPGPVRFAGGVALSQAAILGWPVLVCVVLSLPTPAAARLPLCIVIGLAVAAIVVPALVAFGAAVRASRETVFATTLAIAVASAVGALTIATGSMLPDRQPAQPASPNPPSLAPLGLQRPRGGELGDLVLLEAHSTCESSQSRLRKRAGKNDREVSCRLC